MSEMRQNLITREWVIIATERAKRPDQFTRSRDRKPLNTALPEASAKFLREVNVPAPGGSR